MVASGVGMGTEAGAVLSLDSMVNVRDADAIGEEGGRRRTSRWREMRMVEKQENKGWEMTGHCLFHKELSPAPLKSN